MHRHVFVKNKWFLLTQSIPKEAKNIYEFLLNTSSRKSGKRGSEALNIKRWMFAKCQDYIISIIIEVCADVHKRNTAIHNRVDFYHSGTWRCRDLGETLNQNFWPRPFNQIFFPLLLNIFCVHKILTQCIMYNVLSNEVGFAS